jgi:hypothetical protein
MMRLLKRSFIAAAGLSIAANAAIAAPEHERLRGTVSAISPNGLTVHTATGNVSMSLSGDTKYLTAARSDLNHIVIDSYIGVATKDVGDKLVALDVLIFPPPMKGAAEGHFPWDKLPDTTLTSGASTPSSMTNGRVTTQGRNATTVNSTMTNGSVATASERGGTKQQLKVTYKNGEQTILVPPTAPIVTLQIGALSDIKAGYGVFVNATADGGETTADLIIVGADGAAPPI